ncbi:MAG TPA: type II secretion system protein [Phycisphaerae bacterium]|nr:type II secretion system protein [Phycisphaerae bacterium]
MESRMNRADFTGGQKWTATRAFTLIELLVVISIIAVLISIIMPAISGSRKHGMAVTCATHLHDVGQAMASYLADNNGVYPPSYIYPYDGDGNYDLLNQPNDHPYGYIHWSWYLYNKGQVSDDVFKCPAMTHGGLPRTNPGPSDWEPGQQDQDGNTSPSGTAIMDKQAPRIAYTGNAAIFPRNKFTKLLSGGPRVNVLVPETRIHDPGRVVLMTEWVDNWKAIGIGAEGGETVKSHRPVNPFGHVATGTNEYAAPEALPGFSYGPPPDFGLLPLQEVEARANLVDDMGTMETNAVGRHHPGGKGRRMGGAVNWLYVDLHVEKKAILETVQNHEWGNTYYSISGKNKVGPPWDG